MSELISGEDFFRHIGLLTNALAKQLEVCPEHIHPYELIDGCIVITQEYFVACGTYAMGRDQKDILAQLAQTGQMLGGKFTQAMGHDGEFHYEIFGP